MTRKAVARNECSSIEKATAHLSFANGDIMTFIDGRHWGFGLSSPTAFNQTTMLGVIGRRLRTRYEDVMDEPMPHRLEMLVKKLEERLGSPSSDPSPEGSTGS
jgi:Anti-sigma factor NepR